MLTRPDRPLLLAILLALAALVLPALAFRPQVPGLTAEPAPSAADSDPVTISLEAQRTAVRPGDTLAIAVILDHIKGWHTHTNAQCPRGVENAPASS